MQQVTLRAGDYVATEGMTEDQYYWVVKAFENAGCQDRHDEANKRPMMDYLEWYLGDLCATNTVERKARELTIDQVLNATNAGGKKTDMQNWTPADLFKYGDGEWGQREGDCYVTRSYKGGELIKTVYHELGDTEKEADMHITDQLHKALQIRDEAQACYEQVLAEHRKAYPWLVIEERNQPTSDMSDPANWRAGDVVVYENNIDPRHWYTVGKEYVVAEKKGALGVFDDDGEFLTQGMKLKHFCFVRRP